MELYDIDEGALLDMVTRKCLVDRIMKFKRKEWTESKPVVASLSELEDIFDIEYDEEFDSDEEYASDDESCEVLNKVWNKDSAKLNRWMPRYEEDIEKKKIKREMDYENKLLYMKDTMFTKLCIAYGFFTEDECFY